MILKLNVGIEISGCLQFVGFVKRKVVPSVKQVISVVIGEGNGTPLQYSCLENPMDRGAWWATVHGVAKGRTRLSDFTFTFHFHALEKEMATHSCVLAWRIPGMGEPGGLPSMGSQRVRHDWSDLTVLSWESSCNSAPWILPLDKGKIQRTVKWLEHGIGDSYTLFLSLMCLG